MFYCFVTIQSNTNIFKNFVKFIFLKLLQFAYCQFSKAVAIPHTNDGLKEICSKAFFSMVGISRFRVQNIYTNYLSYGTQPKDNRGDDTRSRHYLEKKDNVRQFILKSQNLNIFKSRQFHKFKTILRHV